MTVEHMVDRFTFRGAFNPPLVANREGRWCRITVQTAGAPTVQGNAGALRCALTADNEAQLAQLYFGDVLAYDIDDIISATFLCKVPATLDAATGVSFGLMSAYNATLDNVAAGAWFRLDGSNNVACESDDGASGNNDDIASGQVLGATYKRFQIHFADRPYTQDPPSASLGGKGNISFLAGNVNGRLRRVATRTRFDLSAYSAGLQPFARIEKTADTNTDFLDLLMMEIAYKISA